MSSSNLEQIYIKTTESCQLHCWHCYINDFRQQKSFFDLDKTIQWCQEYIRIFNKRPEDILFTFHGGEPFLDDLHKLQLFINAFPESNFIATTNLCFPLTKEFVNFIKVNFIDPTTNRPYIKTSWDHKIRFSNPKQLDLWEKNVRCLMDEGIDVHVTICLTSLLIKEINPRWLFEYFDNLGGVKSLGLERLTHNTTEQKDLIPDYEKLDRFLYKMFLLNGSKYPNFKIEMFENIKLAISGNFIGCRKRQCMSSVLTINADGSIGGCPNSSLLNSYTNINESPIQILKNRCRECLIKKEQIRNEKCYLCSLFKYCNGDCHQLSWQNNICPAPRRILKHLAENRTIRLKSKIDRELLILNAIENKEVPLPDLKKLSLDQIQKGDLSFINKEQKANFIFPQKIRYSIFKHKLSGSIDSDISYYCYNLPFAYYKEHLVKDNELRYDENENEWTSGAKNIRSVNFLIEDIAKDGFKQPLIFLLTEEAQLVPLCCSTRIMIACYLQLPKIPAVIVLPKGWRPVGNKDCKELARDILKPEILI